MKRNKIKTFITYAEFNPTIRSIYPFIRNTNNQIKIVSIQHGHSNENLLFSDIKKEFSKDLREDGSYFSPSPDIYFTQGAQYNKILKKIFSKKD